jgi:hypothetical protein
MPMKNNNLPMDDIPIRPAQKGSIYDSDQASYAHKRASHSTLEKEYGKADNDSYKYNGNYKGGNGNYKGDNAVYNKNKTNHQQQQQINRPHQ